MGMMSTQCSFAVRVRDEEMITQNINILQQSYSTTEHPDRQHVRLKGETIMDQKHSTQGRGFLTTF